MPTSSLARVALPFAVVFLSTSESLATENADAASLQDQLDRLWVIVCAALVFLMQAGFKMFEAGMVQPKSVTGVAMKNLADWIVACLCFTLVGFGLMFGASHGGWVGTSLFAIAGLDEVGSPLSAAFFLFQLAFAGTAVTIVSGAMSERTGFIPYLVGSAVVAVLVYPIIGHWVWGSAYIEGNKAFLADLGFIDFAGSTVVHSVGAWMALVGVWMVGPRLGRFREDGTPSPLISASLSDSAFGTILLWFGWWGFNGGSGLVFDDAVGPIIVNTNIAAAAGGLTAYCHGRWFQEHRDLNPKLLGGVLGGLVAITACCNIVSLGSALLIGAGAGVVHNLSYELLLRKLNLDDPVGAIPVHGACGVWGTLCVALFGQASLLPHDRLTQIGVQLLGIAVCFVWTTALAYVTYKIMAKTIGLRVSPAFERRGVAITERYVSEPPPPDEQLSDEELLALMGGDS